MPEWAPDEARNRTEHSEPDSACEVPGVRGYPCRLAAGSPLRDSRQFSETVISLVPLLYMSLCLDRRPAGRISIHCLNSRLDNGAMGSGALVLSGQQS